MCNYDALVLPLFIYLILNFNHLYLLDEISLQSSIYFFGRRFLDIECMISLCCYRTARFFLNMECIILIVILQNSTKKSDYTTVYGQQLLQIHFSATKLFQTLRKLYMSLRIIVPFSLFKIKGANFTFFKGLHKSITLYSVIFILNMILHV